MTKTKNGASLVTRNLGAFIKNLETSTVSLLSGCVKACYRSLSELTLLDKSFTWKIWSRTVWATVTTAAKSTTDCQETSHQKERYHPAHLLTDSQQQLGIRIDFQEMSLEARGKTFRAYRLFLQVATNQKAWCWTLAVSTRQSWSRSIRYREKTSKCLKCQASRWALGRLICRQMIRWMWLIHRLSLPTDWSKFLNLSRWFKNFYFMYSISWATWLILGFWANTGLLG